MTDRATRWRRLRDHVDSFDAADVGATSGRVGAVLALLADRGDDIELVLTRRRDDLTTHPGQVSFAGGRREPGETIVDAALREAEEEIGLQSSSVQVLGGLPAFYIPPSRFWLAPVVARWRRPHPLTPQASEVAAIVRPTLAQLCAADRRRKVRLSVTGWSWAWQLDDDHVLWGATAFVVAMLLDGLAPGWRDGAEPQDLPDDREVQPWKDVRLDRRVTGPRLRGTGQRDRADVSVPAAGVPAGALAGAGLAIADAVERFEAAAAVSDGDRASRVVVLAGPGGTGRVGVASAGVLRQRGHAVRVIHTSPAAAARATADGPVGSSSEAVAAYSVFDETVPVADLYVDAMVGAGLDGGLRGTPRDVLLALRMRDVPILSVDLPSGLHPTEGLVGDTLSATVTVALGGVWPAVRMAGMAPFVGDLYLSDDVQRLVRLVAGPERSQAGGWRE